jgi:hypothetical protein
MTNDEYELFKAKWLVKFLPLDQKLTKLQLKKLNNKINYESYQRAIQEEMKLLEEKKKLIEQQTEELIKMK